MALEVPGTPGSFWEGAGRAYGSFAVSMARYIWVVGYKVARGVKYEVWGIFSADVRGRGSQVMKPDLLGVQRSCWEPACSVIDPEAMLHLTLIASTVFNDACYGDVVIESVTGVANKNNDVKHSSLPQ